jgi:hypothetical protein
MMISKIEVSFAIPVDLTEEEMRVIDLIANHAARRTETKDRVHWAAGVGSKPIWSRSDHATGMVRGEPDPRAKETGEPDFDDTVFYVETCCRERYDTEPLKIRHDSLALDLVRMLQQDRDGLADRLKEVLPTVENRGLPNLVARIRKALRL